MNRSLVMHSVIAGLSAMLALVAWVRPDDGSDQKIHIFAGDTDRATKIEWSDADTESAVERDGKNTIVSVLDKRQKKGAEPAAAPKARMYAGTPKAEEMFKILVPLEAVRSMGKTEDDKLAEFGLNNPTGVFKAHFGDRVEEVKVGTTTFGGTNTYVLGPDQGVYLIKSFKFSDMKNGASALVEKQVLPVEKEDVVMVKVTSGGKTREFVQTDRELKGKAYFASAKEPTTKLEDVTGWMDRTLRLRALESTDAAPTGPSALKVEVMGSKGVMGSLELWQAGENVAYATSTRQKATMVIPKAAAEPILADVQAFLAETK